MGSFTFSYLRTAPVRNNIVYSFDYIFSHNLFLLRYGSPYQPYWTADKHTSATDQHRHLLKALHFLQKRVPATRFTAFVSVRNEKGTQTAQIFSQFTNPTAKSCSWKRSCLQTLLLALVGTISFHSIYSCEYWFHNFRSLRYLAYTTRMQSIFTERIITLCSYNHYSLAADFRSPKIDELASEISECTAGSCDSPWYIAVKLL